MEMMETRKKWDSEVRSDRKDFICKGVEVDKDRSCAGRRGEPSWKPQG